MTVVIPKPLNKLGKQAANANAKPDTAELEREVVKLGTDNQRSRHAEGQLPEDELLCIARGELFKPFDRFRPWHNRNLRAQSVRHADKMCRGHIKFETCEPDGMSHDEWEVLADLRRAADIAADHHWIIRSAKLVTDARELVVVEPLMHFAACVACKSEESRASAKIHIAWAGRVLTREYAL